MSAQRPTFSPMWHRVRAMRPRLRPHTQVTRQHYRGRRWHVVHDPASNQFYRLSPIAHEFVGLLDGARTVEEVWNLSLRTHGDAAPTQQEVIELLSQMYNSNLLAVDATPETEQLLSRGRERVKKRVQQQAIGLMYFRVRLFNPDRYLSWLEPILRPVLNRWGLIAWAAWVVFALVSVLPEWERLGTAFTEAISPSNWGWLIVVFVVIKAIHETGHGVITKRFGGQVPEFGAMMLVLMPAPYVDASACWAFPSKWRRMAVGAGGMIFELAVAAGAALVWLATPAGGLLNQLAFNAMFTASVSTVVFNANPLMRFDGYYILSDLLEVPNLMQRSMKMLLFLCQKWIYRIREARPPSTSGSEQATLIVYGVLALAYRVFLFFAITLYIMGQLFAIGLVLAVWTAAAWFILPVGKFVHWLATSPQLSDSRARAVATSLLLAVAGVLLIGAVPAPDHRRGVGVVESLHRSGVFFGADGFVETAHVGPGDRVKAGDPIVTCSGQDLEAKLASGLAELAEFEAVERDVTTRDTGAAQVARQRVRAQRDYLDVIRKRLALLVVRAPHDGVVVAGYGGRDPRSIVGSWVTRGEMLCDVVDDEHVRVAATMTQAEAAWLYELPRYDGEGREEYSVQMRLVSEPSRVVKGGDVRAVPAGQQKLPHAGLGYTGGGDVEVDARDPSGVFAKRPQFVVYVVPAPGQDGWIGRPGERVHLRFGLPSRPLLWQWVDRLQKLIQGRVQL